MELKNSHCEWKSQRLEEKVEEEGPVEKHRQKNRLSESFIQFGAKRLPLDGRWGEQSGHEDRREWMLTMANQIL